jgi:aryl-alcohol dehydrogenase-like predicted oxidoreductase
MPWCEIVAVHTVRLASTDLTCSKFIFGTASLFSAGTRRRRIDLLAAAVDCGFTHFDTAPYYGFGMAERDLSPVLAAHPHTTLTTKVGIGSPGGESQTSLAILLRKAAGRAIPAVSRPTRDFTLKAARRSLESSLRRLKRECIDLYLLHEPHLESLNADEWQDWLQACVNAGKIRAFGLAAEAERIEPFLVRAPALAQVVQVLDSLDRKEADLMLRHKRSLQITYGYVSAARVRCANTSVRDILDQSINRNRDGAIIVSTRRRERLGQYSESAGSQR